MTSSPDDSATTRRLLSQARAGDPAARDELFTRHRGYLQRVVELRLDGRLRARLDPSDVVQEAQLEANRRLDGYLGQPALPFRLWLRQITYDRLLMLRRHHLQAARRTVEREVALPERSSMLLGRQLLTGAPTPSEQLSRSELARRVRQALGQLSETDREVVLMRNFEGLTNQEIARALGLQPATASQRYGRALLRLRTLLVEGGFSGAQP
jgi:RNA polymerase sigma-70 factor (ECF subfamily)